MQYIIKDSKLWEKIIAISNINLAVIPAGLIGAKNDDMKLTLKDGYVC